MNLRTHPLLASLARIAAAVALTLGGVAAYQSSSANSCCHPGAACCTPGAACCAGHAHTP